MQPCTSFLISLHKKYKCYLKHDFLLLSSKGIIMIIYTIYIGTKLAVMSCENGVSTRHLFIISSEKIGVYGEIRK